MTRTPWLHTAATVGLTALVLAACGGGDGDRAASPAPEDTVTGTAPEGGERQNVDGKLKIGTVLPQTGDLAALGPAMVEAVRMGVEHVNEAGGVLGEPIELVEGDSGTNEQIANSVVDDHLRNNVDAIIGAASSRITLSIIDKVTSARVVECSPSNTGSNLTNYEADDPGFYFRTPPADNLQATALAELIAADGFSNVGIIALNDDYGQGFAKSLTMALQKAGATAAVNVPYDPVGTEFSADVQKLNEVKADSVVVISFPDTGSKILREMIAKGLGPDSIAVYTADGMQSGEVPKLVDPNNPAVLDGVKGTAPSSQGSEAFKQAFNEFAPEGTPQIFSAHAYDCVNIIALAAEKAGTDDPNLFRLEIVPITKDGDKCKDYASCKSLVDEGADVDYEGAAGPLDFVKSGEPAAGTYEVWVFNAAAEDGYEVTKTRDVASTEAT
ncbi:MAG TPA: ABC transporter substrate-binding protein [Nitriliruptorales bacterium]|nr:ABC transporter substrate-binding protein [Nitriliruptorales bacterium]